MKHLITSLRRLLHLLGWSNEFIDTIEVIFQLSFHFEITQKREEIWKVDFSASFHTLLKKKRKLLQLSMSVLYVFSSLSNRAIMSHALFHFSFALSLLSLLFLGESRFSCKCKVVEWTHKKKRLLSKQKIMCFSRVSGTVILAKIWQREMSSKTVFALFQPTYFNEVLLYTEMIYS